MKRAFSLIELMTVMAVFAIVGAVALPSIRAIATRKQEVEYAGEAQTKLNGARDTAYKQLECVGVTAPNPVRLQFDQWDCAVLDAGVTTTRIDFDRTIVSKVDIMGGGAPVVFQPSGGLQSNSLPRIVQLNMRSGRKSSFEIQPAIGTIRECKSVDLSGPKPVCLD